MRTSGVGAEAPDLLGQLLVPAELLGQDLGAHLGQDGVGCRAASERGSGGRGAEQRMLEGGGGGAVASGTVCGAQAATQPSQEHCRVLLLTLGSSRGPILPSSMASARPSSSGRACRGRGKCTLVRGGVVGEGSLIANWLWWCAKKGVQSACRVRSKQTRASQCSDPAASACELSPGGRKAPQGGWVQSLHWHIKVEKRGLHGVQLSCGAVHMASRRVRSEPAASAWESCHQAAGRRLEAGGCNHGACAVCVCVCGE